MSFAGKVIIVTGGTKGIGRATATAFVNAGASVAVSYSSDAAAADSLVSELGKDKVLAVKADAGSADGNSALVDATVARFGRLDVAVANAGIMPLRTLESTTEADFDRVFAVNVKGSFFLAQKALPHLVKTGGNIILFSTTICYMSTIQPAMGLYTATKGAVEQLVRAFAKETGGKGVRVNAIAPGPIATELFYQGRSEEEVKPVAAQSPFNRIGRPEEVASAVLMLAGPGAGWVSGQVLKVNGATA